MEKKEKLIGIIDTDGYEKENRCYSGGGTSPTILSGNGKIKTLREYRIEKHEENNNSRSDG